MLSMPFFNLSIDKNCAVKYILDMSAIQTELFPEFKADPKSPYSVETQKFFWENQKDFYTAEIPNVVHQSKTDKLLALNNDVYPLMGYTVDAYVVGVGLCTKYKCSYVKLEIDTGDRVITAIDWVGLRSKLLTDDEILSKQKSYRNLFCANPKSKKDPHYDDYVKYHNSLSAYYGIYCPKYKFKVRLLVTPSPHGYIHFVVKDTERIALQTKKKKKKHKNK